MKRALRWLHCLFTSAPCADCNRLCYYDYDQEDYRHLFRRGKGCGLIGSEDEQTPTP